MRDGKTARRQDGKQFVGATSASPAFPLISGANPSSPTLLPSERGEGSRKPPLLSPTGRVPAQRVAVGGEGKRRDTSEGDPQTSSQLTTHDLPSGRNPAGAPVSPSSTRAGI